MNNELRSGVKIHWMSPHVESSLYDATRGCYRPWGRLTFLIVALPFPVAGVLAGDLQEALDVHQQGLYRADAGILCRQHLGAVGQAGRRGWELLWTVAIRKGTSVGFVKVIWRSNDWMINRYIPFDPTDNKQKAKCMRTFLPSANAH